MSFVTSLVGTPSSSTSKATSILTKMVSRHRSRLQCLPIPFGIIGHNLSLILSFAASSLRPHNCPTHVACEVTPRLKPHSNSHELLDDVLRSAFVAFRGSRNYATVQYCLPRHSSFLLLPGSFLPSNLIHKEPPVFALSCPS